MILKLKNLIEVQLIMSRGVLYIELILSDFTLLRQNKNIIIRK